jgi:hypothetical protein
MHKATQEIVRPFKRSPSDPPIPISERKRHLLPSVNSQGAKSNCFNFAYYGPNGKLETKKVNGAMETSKSSRGTIDSTQFGAGTFAQTGYGTEDAATIRNREKLSTFVANDIDDFERRIVATNLGRIVPHDKPAQWPQIPLPPHLRVPFNRDRFLTAILQEDVKGIEADANRIPCWKGEPFDSTEQATAGEEGLIVAARSNSIVALRTLLAYPDANVEKLVIIPQESESASTSAIWEAVRYGRSDVVAFLLDFLASKEDNGKVASIDGCKLMEEAAECECTMLEAAVALNFNHVAQVLLQFGAAPTDQALAAAVLAGNTELMTLLLETGANASSMTSAESSISLLQTAAVKDDVRAVEKLLEHGGDATLVQVEEIVGCDRTIFESILRSYPGDVLEQTVLSNKELLSDCVENGYVDNAELLLKLGCTLEVPEGRRSLLSVVVEQGSLPLVRKVADAGCRVNRDDMLSLFSFEDVDSQILADLCRAYFSCRLDNLSDPSDSMSAWIEIYTQALEKASLEAFVEWLMQQVGALCLAVCGKKAYGPREKEPEPEPIPEQQKALEQMKEPSTAPAEAESDSRAVEDEEEETVDTPFTLESVVADWIEAALAASVQETHLHLVMDGLVAQELIRSNAPVKLLLSAGGLLGVMTHLAECLEDLDWNMAKDGKTCLSEAMRAEKGGDIIAWLLQQGCTVSAPLNAEGEPTFSDWPDILALANGKDCLSILQEAKKKEDAAAAAAAKAAGKKK